MTDVSFDDEDDFDNEAYVLDEARRGYFGMDFEPYELDPSEINAKVKCVETYAMVVGVYDFTSLDYADGYIPCEPALAVGYSVLTWNHTTGGYDHRCGPFEDRDVAVFIAEQLHIENAALVGYQP